jgi:phosphatidylglycerophosphatase A
MRRLVAATGGVGFIPKRLWGTDSGAGTMGAAVAVVGAILLIRAPWWVDALVAGIAIVVSLWASAPFSKDSDPGWVCIDEVAGTLVAVIGLSGGAWIVAVIVARLADIYKVLPGVGEAERLPGPWGITMDDVVAGLYGLAVGWLMTAFI